MAHLNLLKIHVQTFGDFSTCTLIIITYVNELINKNETIEQKRQMISVTMNVDFIPSFIPE